MIFKSALTILMFLAVCHSGFAQQNISTSSVTFIGTQYSVNAIIGDTFLGASSLEGYAVEHSILSSSGEIVLGFTAENPIKLKAYPNPVIDNIHIAFQHISDYEISVINTAGLEVKKVSTTADINLRLDNIPKGVYIIKIVDKKKNQLNVFEIIKL